MKITKKTLLRSLLSLLLCCTMLIGTTFAWFTDSVESGRNRIVAGNLDVELEYLNANGQWKTVREDTNVFPEDALWEPGHTQIVYLKVSNLGNLALKYQLGVNIVSEKLSVNVYNEPLKLSDHIQLGVETNRDGKTNPWATRTDAVSAVSATARKLNTGYTGTGKLYPKDNCPVDGKTEQYVALVVYMPESVGNEANHKAEVEAPEIHLGISLVATQQSAESDSFGSDYDDQSKFPTLKPGSVSGEVQTSNGLTTQTATIQGDGISADVPVGVKVDKNLLTLSVSEMQGSNANISLETNELLRSLDVHIDGVAAGNTVPMKIKVERAMMIGLNTGNFTLYHVENGVPVAMTSVASLAELDAHNEFFYDPATGDVVLSMATFSEVALVANTENAWNGNVATAFAGGTGTESDDPYIIANADQFVYFGDLISNDNENYGEKYYKLIADINLGGEENANKGKLFYPIGYHAKGGEIAAIDIDDAPEFLFFEEDPDYARNLVNAVAEGDTTKWYTYGGSFKGTFDGNGHTIANIYQNTWQLKGNYDGNYWNAAMGIFGYVNGGTVKNLTVNNFSSDGEFTPTGVIAAYAVNSTFENIAITNCNPRVYNTGNGGIVGIGGNSSDPDDYKLTFTNITIDNTNKITALWGSWDVACGGLVGMFRGAGHVHMTNCHVAAQIDVYNDVCGNYQYYWYRYSGMMIGTNKNMTTDANGYTVPETDKFHAGNCTVHFGDWNDYYYCELVANSLASYTHDHQFSRLTQISSLDEIKSGDTWKKAGNFLLISDDSKTCYHIVNKNGTLTQHYHEDAGEETVGGKTVLKEDKQVVYLPFNQLFTGYGWGVKHIPVYNGKDYAFKGVTILDREVANSVEKFETKFTGDFLYRVGNQNTVSIGSLFAVVSKKDANGNVLKDENGKTIYWDINSSGVVVTIDKVDKNSNVSGVFTANTSDWTKGAIQFSGTGVVKVTIQDYNFCTPTVLYLEVVDATNLTSATGTTTGGTFVLLNDVNTSTYVNYWNCTLYGNGFTYSLKGAPTTYNSKQGHGILIAQNTTFDNVKIVGDIYTGYGAYKDNDYYNTAVDVVSDTTFRNCYIANCAAPIKARGNVTIIDSTLYGGSVANLLLVSGTATLENVTTANYDDGRAVVGMGIVVHSDATESAKLVLNGKLTQYNFINESKVPTDSYAQELHKAMFDSSCAKYHFGTSPNSYVNTGIISLTSTFNGEDITDNAKTGYTGMSLRVSSYNGYVYTQPNTSGSANNNYSEDNFSGNQGDYLPTPNFNLGDQAVTAEDRYLKGNINGIEARYVKGGAAFTLDIDKLMTVEKYGISLPVSAVCMDAQGKEYTGVVTLSAAGTYTLKFTATDNLIYDKIGNLTGESKERIYTVSITLVVAEPAIKDAVITVNKTAQDGSYSGFTDKTITFNPLEAIKITDAEGTVNLTTNIASTSIAYASSSSAFAGATTITVTYNDGRILTITLGKPSLNSPGSSKAVTYANDGTIKSAGAVASKSATGGTWTVTSYSFKGTNGKTITNNTVVTYTFPDKSCVTGDTLVMLADGTQKRIDEVTYSDELLVWDFFNGKYTTVPSAIIFYHGDDLYDVLSLHFEDGTTVKTINVHGFFDIESNSFEFIDAENVESYIGHRFVKVDGKNYKTVKLIGYDVAEEYTGCYSIQSAMHNNFITEGMFSLTIPYYEGWFDYFEIGDNMKYDEAKMQADIEKYGLYTYEDFADYVTYEQFIAFNGPYLKVLVGRGVVTWEQIIELIATYVN